MSGLCSAISRRRSVSALAVCAAVISWFAAPAAAADPASPRATTATTDKKAESSLPVSQVRAVPGGDEIVDGRGDSDGWHLYAASSGDAWAWQPLATLAPAGLDGN